MVVEQLATPPCPPCLRYLWDWFCDLSSARGGSGFSLAPIGYVEIDAWARLTDVRPTPWEVGVLRRLDATLLRTISDARSGRAYERRSAGHR